MNYKRIYEELISKAVGREEIGGYYETHHIIPKSLGGGDGKNNLVKLTYREHFIAHWLLHREYPKDKSLAAAFHIMAFGKSWRKKRELVGGYIPSSRSLAEAKEAYVFHRTGTKHSEETKQKMRKPRGPLKKPRPPISEETKEKMRLAKLGKKRSEEEKLAISKGKKLQTPSGDSHHRFGKSHTEETKSKMSKAWDNRR